MRDELRRLALFTSGVAELTRHRAEQIVKQWVNTGEVRRDQAGAMVKGLLDASRESRKELMRFVRAEVQAQVAALGVASKRDVERLERRVARLEERSRKTGAKRTTKTAPAKKTTRSKSASAGGEQG